MARRPTAQAVKWSPVLLGALLHLGSSHDSAGLPAGAGSSYDIQESRTYLRLQTSRTYAKQGSCQSMVQSVLSAKLVREDPYRAFTTYLRSSGKKWKLVSHSQAYASNALASDMCLEVIFPMIAQAELEACTQSLLFDLYQRNDEYLTRTTFGTEKLQSLTSQLQADAVLDSPRRRWLDCAHMRSESAAIRLRLSGAADDISKLRDELAEATAGAAIATGSITWPTMLIPVVLILNCAFTVCLGVRTGQLPVERCLGRKARDQRGSSEEAQTTTSTRESGSEPQRGRAHTLPPSVAGRQAVTQVRSILKPSSRNSTGGLHAEEASDPSRVWRPSIAEMSPPSRVDSEPDFPSERRKSPSRLVVPGL